MQKRIITAIFAVLGIPAGIAVMPRVWALAGMDQNELFNNFIVNAIIGALFFIVLAFLLAGVIMRLIARADQFLSDKSPTYILFGSLSTIVGLILATLISQLIFFRLPNGFLSTVPPIILMIIFGYLGFRVGTTRRHEWRRLLMTMRRNNNDAKPKPDISQADDVEGVAFHQYKILDTSVIIDGRIQALAKTGFIEGTLLVPNFVLHELQLISDSADSLKRERGRRGLDILNQMQKDKNIRIEMTDSDFEGSREVDGKLLKLAKEMDAVVVSNDYNLGKVSEFQNVPILNINELATALKPEVIPGEEMMVHIVKAGTERQQGVAYMPEGTMVVVEDGQYYMDQNLRVIVTSAIQTNAGRMIFAKPAHSVNPLGKDATTEATPDPAAAANQTGNAEPQNGRRGRSKARGDNKN
ncbi:PIN/TRAM domain-containing protein [Lacticaseibacillus pantheris]|jgi:uncharacterized protein YacL|uniref:PIN/TRAM domain-containing protein n=1 Tax=Lacticaseibacillus pantheris TaxID=171523 RepID=UPI00265AD1CE|nr:PIN/TRAM domain-containing protein [Lacticaseibacillus pantheris]WKF84613.1 PIN/TRAM domain-containing protein [Lacticaseibacillus pantheris]